MNIFNPDVLGAIYKEYPFAFIAAIFIMAFGLTYLLVPKVIMVTWRKRLFKELNSRSSHSKQTPSFGGGVFFMVLVLFISIFQTVYKYPTGSHLIAAMTVLFMVGLKDDLVVSAARVKFVGQIFAALLVVFTPELYIAGFHGFLGIETLNPWVSRAFAGFVILSCINSYNMIDGINGLAATIGIIISTVYGLIFYLTGKGFFLFLSVVMIGMLLAFLRFNISEGKRRIFMGDSGSLIIGLIIGVMSISVLALDRPIPVFEKYTGMENRLLLVGAVLFIPLFDTLRVIIIRLYQGRNPFDADQNHLHHALLRRGMTHVQASFCLGFLNALVVVLYWGLSKTLEGWLLILGYVFICLLVFCLVEFSNRQCKTRRIAK